MSQCYNGSIEGTLAHTSFYVDFIKHTLLSAGFDPIKIFELVVLEQEVLILTLIWWVDWKPYYLPAFQISEYEQCCIDWGPCLQLHAKGSDFLDWAMADLVAFLFVFHSKN